MTKPRRVEQIPPFHVMALLARARELEAEGRDIVHMEIGEPDFATPAPVVEAASRAIAGGDVHYTPAAGLPQLRQAIARFYLERYNVEVEASRIMITPGASGALLLALGVLMGDNSEVLVPDPGYPCNSNFVRFLGGKARQVAVSAEEGFQLSARSIRAHWSDDTVAAMVATPSNPTGSLIDRETLASLFLAVNEKGGSLIVDEIYHGLVYGAETATALSVSDEIFVINSFSKYFNMTGWRLGWLVVPEKYVADVDRLAQNIFLAAPTPAQYAALAAFGPETLQILEEHRLAFQQRRDYLLPAIRQLGFTVEKEPEGAFYLYAGCEKFTDDSFQFCHQLLEEAGVAITPGIDFGQHHAEQHVRFAYTTSLDRLEEGVTRLQQFLS